MEAKDEIEIDCLQGETVPQLLKDIAQAAKARKSLFDAGLFYERMVTGPVFNEEENEVIGRREYAIRHPLPLCHDGWGY